MLKEFCRVQHFCYICYSLPWVLISPYSYLLGEIRTQGKRSIERLATASKLWDLLNHLVHKWVAFGNALAGAERFSGNSAVKIIATSTISFKITKTSITLFHSIFGAFKFREPNGKKEKETMWEFPPSFVNMVQ